MITILCSGSRGDFQPYIALAQQLMKTGRSVRMVGGRSFEAFIRGYGIDYWPLSADYQTADIDPGLLQAAQSSDNPLKMLLTFNKMKHLVTNLTEEMFEACRGSEAIVWHPGCSIGWFAAELLDIPGILATPFPLHRTREYASVIAYGKSRMPVGLSYTLLQQMLWMAGKLGVATVLKKQANRSRVRFGNPYERVDERHPAIVSCSPHVFARPKDWNRHIHMTGYWFVEEDTPYVPSDELAHFLNDGEKPVYFGFGSVFDKARLDETVDCITKATKACGRRGIVSGMGDAHGLPDHLLAVGSLPHSWLFPKVSAVCHHGGAGTAAAGFQAGVPSIIVPFSNDQFAWAHRSHDLGVGAKPVYRRNLTSNALEAAIRGAHQPDVMHRAAALGRSLSLENGAREGARVILERLER